MKKQILILVVGLMAFTTLFSQNRISMDYKDNWKKVQEYEEASLPKSASEEVAKIMQKAIADKNSPQVIKALIHQGIYDLEIDEENSYGLFVSLNKMIEESTDVVEQSVLHSMLGELYNSYYQNYSWEIDKRTNLGDVVPDEMKEWTKNIFYNKIIENMNASILHRDGLLKSLVEDYAAVVKMGSSSRKYYPTIYDFLARRRIEVFEYLQTEKDLTAILSAKEIDVKNLFADSNAFVSLDFNPSADEYSLWILEAYKDLLISLKSRDMRESILMTELELIDYLKVVPTYHDKYAVDRMKEMLAMWSNEPISVEIVYAIVNEINEGTNVGYRGVIKNDDNDKKKEIYEMLKQYIAKYPNYERIGILQNELTNLINPEYSLSGNSTYEIKGDKRIKLSYRNLSNLSLKLYKINSAKDVLMSTYNNNSFLSNATFVKDINLNLAKGEEYIFNEYEFSIDIEKEGIYVLRNANESADSRRRDSNFLFSVSDLAIFARSAEEQYEFFVVNRITGKPIENAKVDIYKLPGNWNNSKLVKEKSISTNSIGLATYKKDIPNYDVFYNIRTGDNVGTILNRLPSSFYSTVGQTVEREQISILTDRGLYRPGQTVYFKAIVTKSDGKKSNLVNNKKYKFELRDANGNEQSSITLSANEFGSVSGEFVLPTDVLNGMFTIRTEYGATNVRVEEYKRPTFDITFDKIDKTYSFGEEVKVCGKVESFSGIKLQDVDVTYSIKRNQMMWRMWGGNTEQFDNGVVRTDNEGNFEILFTPQKPDMSSKLFSSIYNFAIEVSVTDINGETQSSVNNIIVGDVSMILSLEIKDVLEKNSLDKIMISATNLDGESISAKGTYTIYSLHDNDSINKEVSKGSFDVGEQKLLKSNLQALSSGKYRIKLFSQDDQGREVKDEKDVVLFSYSDKRPPIKTNEWFVVKSSTFSENKPAEIIFGATDNIYVLYELWQMNTLIERKWMPVNNENHLFSFPYKESYKEGVTLMLNYVKDGKFYSNSINILLEEEVKELNVSLDVFRDKISPNSEEEWRISVRDSKGNPTVAEVLASMYDLSLDKIYKSPRWNFISNARSYYWSRMSLYDDNSAREQQSNWRSISNLIDTPFLIFDTFDWFDLDFYYYPRRMYTRQANMGVLYESSVAAPAPALRYKKAEATGFVDDVAQEYIVMEDSDSNANIADVTDTESIRRNFSETAFFYPHLVTNDKGETQIAFTVPDTNTKWKFRVLAHDKNLNIGQAEGVTMSQKELMITPNMPRFVRHGDRTSISTKITNLSDVVAIGVARIEFFNPITDEEINITIVEDINQHFSIDVNESTQASWLFDVPSDIDMLGVRIVAQSQNFSDGEQHALVVLPNKKLVTETMRMDVNGDEDKQFVFDKLVNNNSDTRQDYRLTLEFTTNPAWYAVQALPVLSTPDNDNSVSWFAAYYANKLGTYIGEAYPKVNMMIDAWKKQGGTSETLLSNLEKNQELKNVLLEETPWVLDAKDETEQMKKLSLLFDLNRSRNITNKSIEILNKLQTYKGGWSWFEGFRPNVGITQYILYGFDQLSKLGINEDQNVASMTEKAIKYIDDEALERFNNLKKHNKSWKKINMLSTTDLEYVYVRSQYPQYKTSKEVSDIIEFYVSVITDNWTKFDLYQRSLIVMIAKKKGNDKLVNSIIKSYREHSTTTDEMGMFWANNRTNVFMSQAAVSVHTFIMEAFKEAGASKDEMDNMKRWLLKQKQTQLWESTHATVDAVYALLSTGTDWFSTDGSATIKMGNEIVDTANKEIGTGYIKKSWGNTEIKPDMGNVEISQRGNTPAWGALYLQYFEEMDKITASEASLSVDKQLFVEQIDSEGEKLLKVDGGLNIGDKVVVRITVRTDRDMEFVHIKDMRASCFEPVDQLSGIRWDGGVLYYQSPKDASTNYYFDTLPRGTYVFEYSVVVNRKGEYSNGITTIQSMYAPEFTSHTQGLRIDVK